MTRVPYVPGFARADEEGPSAKAVGRGLREQLPREEQAVLRIVAGRPDAVAAVEASNAGRLPGLTPIRVGRMAASPFAFLRGAAGLMAHDLAEGPVTGIGAQICGDAHAANFGLYGDARGELVIDLNDFDETVHGPWEWDVKRLATSLVLAGREAGASEEDCRTAARDAAGTYRRTMRLLAKLPVTEAWNALADEELGSHSDARDLLDTLERAEAQARKNTSARFAARSTERGPDGDLRFVDAPPVLRRVPDDEAAAVAASLADYLQTLPEDRLPLLARYVVHDVAFRIVGTGSVGLRSYVVLLLDHRGEPLVLQVKEARRSVLAPYLAKAGLPTPRTEHEGRRVVLGQRRMQVVSDPLLGWTTVHEGVANGEHGRGAGRRKDDGRGAGGRVTASAGEEEPGGRPGIVGGRRRPGGSGTPGGAGAGLPFQVRQFRNHKGSVDPVQLSGGQLDDYARMTGALLARAHAHSADPRVVTGYGGKGDALDEAIAAFAVAYAERTEADHADLVAAIRSGRIAAETGV
ncbi:DUF2252 domain-containing protein [Streptomyces sp. WZ-12]|uniref:DUF2252 domain-containing protein n=1 Tax=Streptomyces sp. WZ-12 TaxID=3030210 RepID=UPI0023815182|nr:DUF2252 domain-containing protein [Streptomyces sp. WZ-12]